MTMMNKFKINFHWKGHYEMSHETHLSFPFLKVKVTKDWSSEPEDMDSNT